MEDLQFYINGHDRMYTCQCHISVVSAQTGLSQIHSYLRYSDPHLDHVWVIKNRVDDS